MSRGLRHGRFVATWEPFANGEYRYWARHAVTQRSRSHGLMQHGYATAGEAIQAMELAEAIALADERTEEVTLDLPRGSGDVTEKVENPYV